MPSFFRIILGVLMASSSQIAVASVLEDLKQEFGVQALADHAGDIVLRGTGESHGTFGGFSLRFDTDGRFLRRVDSRLGTAEAFDGKSGWRADWTGMSISFDLSNLEQAQIEAWITSGVWLVNPRLLNVLEVQSESEGSTELRLKTTGGRTEARLIVSRSSELSVRLLMNGLSGEVEMVFDSYFESEGIRFPGRITRSSAGFVESVTRIERVDWSPEVSQNGVEPSAYLARPSKPDDAHFSAQSGQVELRFAPTGHLLVQPELNGKSTDWFIFDSGAGQSALAATVTDLPEIGQALTVTIFGASKNPVLQAKQISLGPLRINDPVLMTMDMSPLEPYFGEPVGGIIGFDVLSRSVVEIDIDESKMQLHNPAGYSLPSGEWQALRFQDNHPIVPASFAGGTGLFRLDFGAAGGAHGNVLFQTPAVDEFGLLDNQPAAKESQIGGINVVEGMLDWFELAGVRFESPEVVFGRDETGLFSGAHLAGNIGVGFLSAFKVVLDYSNERIAFLKKP